MILLFRDNSVSYFAKQSIVDCGENFKDISELKDIKLPTDDLDEEFISIEQMPESRLSETTISMKKKKQAKVSIKLPDVIESKTVDVETEDVDLEEFSDEIENDVIEQLKSIGCDTAKAVLELSNEELIRRTGLAEETIGNVREILASEFED